jgi:CelD/BcsL family acetyltransferase involved in cellulose biosynthesis
VHATAPPVLGADPPATAWRLDAWRAVLARMDDPHPFVTPQWQLAWWEHFGAGRLEVAPLERGGEVVAVVPLAVDARGRAGFLGAEDVTDYPGAAVVPGAQDALAGWLVDRLAAGRNGWRRLDVRNARSQDGVAGAVRAAAARAGLVTRSGPDEPVAVLDLPDTWDGYLRRLSRQDRHELRRKERRLQRLAPGARVRTADAASLAADLDAFVRLHRAAPGEKGRFLSVTRESFLRRVAADFLALGLLRLDVLEADGRPLALAFGFQTRRTYHLYNMAFDGAARHLSPGVVLLGRRIRQAIEEGLACFDFMRGLERYKLHLGGAPRRLERVTVHAP